MFGFESLGSICPSVMDMAQTALANPNVGMSIMDMDLLGDLYGNLSAHDRTEIGKII